MPPRNSAIAEPAKPVAVIVTSVVYVRLRRKTASFAVGATGFAGATTGHVMPTLPTELVVPAVLPLKRRLWPKRSTTAGLVAVGVCGSAPPGAPSSQTYGYVPHELATSTQKPSCE